ncbi:MAG: ribosome silencing factor [Candidatus Omnitrophota bacterium]
MKKAKKTNSREIVLRIADLALAKKAYDVVALDVRKVSTFCDYFLICSCSSGRMTKAISDAIDEALKKDNIRPHHIEGEEEAKWILMDYGDIIVHIFLEEVRPFYNLEWLWNDAKRIRIRAAEDKDK